MYHARMIRTLVALSFTLAACSHHTGDDSKHAVLTIDPPTSELMIQNGVPAHEMFTATLTYPDGTTEDVTDRTLFAIDVTYGTFSANDLAMSTAGKAQVNAIYTDKMGQAQVIGRVSSVRIDPSLPPNTPDLFNGPEDPSKAPAIAYPPVGTVMPRNLGDFEIHWTDAHGNNVFEISLHTEFSDVRVYVPGGNGLPAAGPMPSWNSFSAAEWLTAVGVQPSVSYRVRGANTAAPGVVGADAPRTVDLSNEPMEGGLYYWATASSTGVYGIFRHDMSKPGQPAEEYMTTNQTSGRCVACHVLSRDGTKMAITYDGGDHNATLLDVATAALQPEANRWNFGTFTPDNSQFISVEDGTMVVRDAATQTVITTMPTSSSVSHPDLSPDGTKLVYVHPSAAAHQDWSFTGGQIYWRTYDPASHDFGPEIPLVNDGANNYYPSWSPDGQWVVFNKNAAGNSYNDPNASVWVVKADGSQPPIELAKANQAQGLTNSWARWAPFPQTYGTTNEPMFWITVSSKRDLGTRMINSGLAEQNKTPQLWMTPFFPDRAAAGQDPSAVLFRLPFQNLTSRNHIAQWTEKVVVTQ